MQSEEKVLLHATVCFLRQGDEILLAKKTKKIGAGCWNGYGGGIEEGETPKQAAVRELFEEAGVRANICSLRKIAIIDFYNTKTDGLQFICRVHFYFVYEWTGEVKETEEMVTPTWFKISEFPWTEMMPADKIWLPPVLCGKKVKASPHYGPFQKELLEDFIVTEVDSFEDEH